MNLAWKKLIHTFLNLILPRSCAGCGAKNEIFCGNCQLASYKRGAQCLFCGFRNQTGAVCQSCKNVKHSMFDKTAVKHVLWVGRYDGALKEAIWQFKYKKRKELAAPLAEMLWNKFLEINIMNVENATLKDNHAIIPIPLHFKKEYERGFNQAELLAREFCKLSNIQCLTNVLIKTRETKAQVAVDNKELRIKNLEGAFCINPKISQSNLSLLTSHALILIDDVATTGATLIHASETLAKVGLPCRQAGAKKIIGLVVAHG
ncbi:hypothetical protein A2926_00475 [Candidatus Giovannonibacteria bacterium RIFCSPLOWO2_01_FULL_44_40]|uniref:Phosphoribosyltransferase domain-containing protein n=1 Tax=Candidatus Giovannonibacteria bacterium RIFCSPHIGHO2_01_FULL_45_23 TaxID=1798325 RepID=A0A1F5VG99_9BACT|nr:MAG: hypothetical protein A2834_00490 [Candidatus Giovannonibacteria bacterium RIFCSPHIGHO2_01_FULL_45_23]OGF76519.1 MAG: hypothetical protein A3C77_03195 [Candidatus Giovannonibacteria bacterium RIFCSPHIGHO2_02_FULL_45_13]OGF79786.1 MAG: hypothetical protein A2926_00475 [Candidatus Giovannonibacteria bacterium RIFCSPLOWO2_01_FULL_44_40]